jgi:predicted ATPase/DNA-binding SARP family transcriptional activator
MAPMLHIYLLGDFRLVYGDMPVTTVNTPRLQSLLAYLVLHRHAPQPRHHLAFLLWPDSTEAQARTNLRHQFHLLRQALPEADRFLYTDAQTLQWRPDAPFTLDVADFESNAQKSSLIALQEAVDLYRGDLLPSCYDDWILPERERLHQRFIEALERLIGLLENKRDYATAISYAQRLLRYDLLHEETYRHLMRLYALNGDQAGVQRTYQECVTVLQRELAAEPSPATRQAYERLVNLDAPLAQRQNLPVQLTPFLGREEELTKIAELLANPACRLLTVVGAGGMGKTRLALQAASGQIGAYLHGVYFVSLVSIRSPDFLVSTIASALNFSFHSSQDPKVQLLNELSEKDMLLVLDSFEHLLDGAGLLVEILTSAPEVKLLVTSRERLNLHGEWLFEIQGLEVPKVEGLARLEEYSAVQLFLQSARRVRADFYLAEEKKPAVDRICLLVEGIPLAIELAAAWVRALSCEEIAQEIAQGLGFLATSLRDVPERHRSMQAVFEYSWHLLSTEERSVFRKLSVFRGGFRREAAERVVGASLFVLASLADKSFLRLDPSGRYDMHELLRQYGREKLREAGEMEQVRDDHLNFFLKLAEVAEPKLHSAEQSAWMKRLKAEHDNLRSALDWSQAEADNLETGLHLVGMLWRFWQVDGYLSEGRERLEGFLTQPRTAKPIAARAKALAGAGFLAVLQSDLGRAAALAEESRVLSQEVGEKRSAALALNVLGTVARSQGDYATASVLYEQSVALSREVEDRWLIGLSLGNQGLLSFYQGDYERSVAPLEEALTFFEEMDYSYYAFTLNVLGRVVQYQGDYGRAVTLFKTCLALFWEHGNKWGLAVGLSGLAGVSGGQGQLERAARLFGAEEALREAIHSALPPAVRADHERALASVRAQMDEATFATAWAEGRAMTLEQAVAYALAHDLPD